VLLPRAAAGAGGLRRGEFRPVVRLERFARNDAGVVAGWGVNKGVNKS